MDVPTFEWKDDVLVSTVGDNYVAFRPEPQSAEHIEKCVGMAGYALWTKDKEHDGWLVPPFNPDSPPPDYEMLAVFELTMAYESDRHAYIEEAQAAYREFAHLTT